MGNNGQGAVIPGQVQGVSGGPGVSIASDGTLSFEADTSAGVIKTNNPGAYNSYEWPTNVVAGSQLTLGSGGKLSWVVRLFGFGLNLTEGNVKVSLPFGSNTNPDLPIPSIGTGTNQAIEGSLYWNSESSQLFICSDGAWTAASYGPSDINEQFLSGTYTLYVNPEIGSDEYVEGVYDSLATPVVTNQMVTAGYTPQKPFKTLQRAALEVARIQAGPQPDRLSYDRFVIKCSAGEHIIDNNPGSNSVSAWVNGTTPSEAQLRAMNSASYAGLILPRGVSVIGEDLRKTVIRPNYVPNKTGNIDTDRGSILRITGGGFFFNFTFKDKLNLFSSHHLLDCFSFVSDADLENYYSKVQTIFAQSNPDIPVNPGETEIVAPKPPGIPEETTDGILGSSPYIFNCSVRSSYGICGVNADGDDVAGFKSLVTAQFTGVSLQKDLYCWQRYNTSTKVWENTIINYGTYISLDPNNLRMDPTRRSHHIRAINGAFIQEVSVFAIGHGVHHWVKGGGEISITNSNSSFGGCAALAEGYKLDAFPQDSGWNVGTLNVATNLTDQETVINIVEIGTVSPGQINNSTIITLEAALVESEVYPGQPQILASRNYTFKGGSYLWIENPEGLAWRAPLDGSAWSTANPANVKITAAMQNQSGASPGIGGQPNLAGSRVFIRRLIDSRTQAQRRYSINITNTNNTVRSPLRDYVVQTTLGASIVDLLPDSDMVIVNKSGPVPIGTDPIAKKSQVVLQRANAVKTWTSGEYYRTGETVRYLNKHYTCIIKNFDATFDLEKWNESYVHMPSDYNAYDFFLNTAPVIYFDNDTDGLVGTATCGYNLSTCWTSDDEIKGQYQTATDYRGVYQFLVGIGFSNGEVEDILVPTPAVNRELDPSSSADMRGYVPNGASDVSAHWPIEFRRPSVLRMFGHAWEWSGFLNYTKALPAYQGDLSAQNQFNYYFTNQLGGRVYATGFNQEGYFVTAAGLTDLSTNATLSVTDLGNPFAGVDVPTYFPELTVDNLRITTTQKYVSGAQISGAPLFSADWYTNFRVASPTLTGITRYATNTEVAAGTAIDLAISPATLASRVASQTQTGITRYATTAETTTGTATDVSISPATLASRVASQTLTGITRYATNAETATGTATDVAISPATLAYASASGVIGDFTAGTRISFNNASPPPGWTTVTDPAFNNAAIRILNSSGAAFPAAGGFGGDQLFTTVFTASRSSGINVATSGAVSGHTLTETELAAHSHTYNSATSGQNCVVGPGRAVESASTSTGSTGSGAAHGHGFTNPTYSMGGLNFNVKYVDFIVAQRS